MHRPSWARSLRRRFASYLTRNMLIKGDLYYIRSSHGTYLHTLIDDAVIVAGKIDRGEQIPVLGYIPNASSEVVYLISSRGWNSLLAMAPRLVPTLIIPLRMEGRGPDKAALIDPSSSLYVSAMPPAADQTTSLITADRMCAQGWEEFTLERSHRTIGSRKLRTMLREINRLSEDVAFHASNANKLDHHPQALHSEPFVRDYGFEIIELCGHLIGNSEALDLANTILNKSPDAASPTQNAGEDFWIDTVLKKSRLGEGNDAAGAERIRRIDHSFDRLDTEGAEGRFASLGHRMNCLVRLQQRPFRRSCIVATARNEGPYLIDWIAYHKSMGVEEIFLYSNDNDDGSDEILRILAEAGEIVWIKNVVASGRKAQTKAYGHAFSVLRDILDYEWAAVIDLDEYIVVDRNVYSTFNDYLDFHERAGADVIHLNWKILSSSGQAEYRRSPVVDRFQRRLPYTDAHTKCIVKPKLCMHATPHYPILTKNDDVKHVNADGSAFTPNGSLSFSLNAMLDPVCINHYFYKSRDEYISKFSRNRGDHTLIKGDHVLDIPDGFKDDFRRQFGADDLREDRTARDSAPGFDRYVSALLGLPGIDAALAAAEDWHAKRVVRIGNTLVL